MKKLQKALRFLGICLFFGGFICLIFSSYSIAEDKGGEDLSSTEEADLDAAEKKITVLDIEGNEGISSSVILSKIKTRVGQPYSVNIARDDIKRLYELGYFSDIKIILEDYQDGIKVVFSLKKKPIVATIAFKGVKSMNREKIRKVTNTQAGQYLDYVKLNQDVKEIQTLYEKRGFSNAAVEYKVNLDSQQEKADIDFIIEEGKRVKIKRITLFGVNSFKDKRILKLMKTKKKGWFRAGLLKEDDLEEDLERILSFYRANGFADVKAEKEVERTRNYIYITITVEEGKQYHVGSLALEGNNIIASSDIHDKLLLVGGEIYTEDKLRDDAAAIQTLYFEKGYIFARVDFSTSLNPDEGLVDITYSVIENEVAYVRRVNVRGNIKTKDKVIRRELRINPGEQFDGKKLKRSRERLYNLGFFEEVGFDMLDTDNPNTKDLVVEVKEAKTGEFSFGGGYSSVDQFIGFFEIAQRNFDFKNFKTFTGAGQDLRLKAQLGSISNSFELSFTEPWIFDYPLSFGFDAYRTDRERESDVGYGFDEDRSGGDIRLAKEFGEFIKSGLTYRIENVKISNIPSDATSDLKNEEGENLISSLGFSLVRDDRDNIFSPTRGTVLGGSIEVAGGPFGGDKDFYRVIGRGVYDMPVFKIGKTKRAEEAKYSVLEFRLRTGIVDEFDDSESVPIYERFYLGGSNSVRGYNERKIGPLDSVTEDPLGGEAMVLANIEYVHPIVDFIKGAVFYDVGNVWADSKDLGNGGFKAGIGLGVRIKTPIGPIKLDYGFPLNEEPGEDTKTGKFHFSVSRGF